jgi:hypothetical protein
MKPGLVKRRFGSIGSPFYSRSYNSIAKAIIYVVASLNWCDEAHSQATRFALKLTPELFVISIDLRTCSLTTKVHLND